jgi:hypothetical protein
MKIECGINSCVHNVVKISEKYGYCECPKDIVLKWRAAMDFGQGAIVMIECLNMQLPE